MRNSLYIFVQMFFYCLGMVVVLQAQPPTDSTTQESCQTSRKHYTFRIRAEKTDIEDTDMVSDTTASLQTTSVALAPTQLKNTAVEPPKIYDGVFGLMNAVAFREEDEIPSNPYVIFDYDVGVDGLISEIRIHNYNDTRLKDIVIRRLNNTRWHPAKNADGDAVVFPMNKQIIQLEGRVYEEDYYKYD